ncbi:hypothetical protein OHA84_33655 [Streptomyces sp. NBC_00513]|uniref:hypothetical protein n=1 Tax=unclassified Streptomyces TaxID=2593676 RepID=UPI0022581067|nr:hypothetical protein [Streptomyces sp. NBC_00424]MCX5071532.1 hypothetical protein [Streptomyces sp. NBC_00424]WUD45069.1 hypothetical protein OHA84_33655 [Streptomyces sp. NBC_00513]
MDVDALMRELYGLRPQEFTAARDARAAEARAAGERAVSKRIGVLRKPTLAVWCANLLARADEGQARRLLELGRALREAHRTLAGEELRELSRRRHVVIAAMARQARVLAGEAGQSISEGVRQEVEQILHAVLTDQEAAEAWAGGVLVKAPDAAVGFAGLEPAPSQAPRRAPRTEPAPSSSSAAKGRSSGARAGSDQETRRRARAAADADADAEAEAKAKAKAKAKALAERAAGEAEKAEAALAQAQDESADHRSRLAALEEQIASLREELARRGEERDHLTKSVETVTRRQDRAEQQAKKARSAVLKATEALDALQDGSSRPGPG